MHNQPALEITDLRKTYDNGVEALKGVSLRVEEGDFYALLGPNGAGKSTLIGVVSSLVNKSAGDVRVFGVDLHADRSQAMRLVGLVPQEINFNMFEQPLDILVNYAGFYGIPRDQALVRAEEELKKAQLWDKARKMSRTLSGGMKRRLMIARAMMTRPKLLILDEPTEGLAPVIVDELVKILRKIKDDGLPVLLVEQNLMVCDKLADRHYVLEQGRVVYEGSAAAFRADRSRAESCYWTAPCPSPPVIPRSTAPSPNAAMPNPRRCNSPYWKPNRAATCWSRRRPVRARPSPSASRWPTS